MHLGKARRVLFAGIASSSLLIGNQGFAQMGGRPPGGAGAGQSMQAPPCKPEPTKIQSPEFQLERINKQLEELRKQLTLTADNKSNFDDFAAKFSAYAADELKRRTEPRAISAGLIGRLKASVAESSNRYAALEDLQISTQRLYENVTEADRKLLDQQTLPLVGM
ncbi:MAG: hypothetical protein RL341_1134 [Pseudomonadota bacterium]|jgi:hypothetical protein